MYVNISRLHLENFQSFKNPTTIRFAPITLLYGQNSVGKSAVFDAIEILDQLCNEKVDWNDLSNIVHMRDKTVTMSIGAGFMVVNPAQYWDEYIKFEFREIFPSLSRFISPWEREEGEEVFDIDYDIIFHIDNYVNLEIKINGANFIALNKDKSTLELNLANPYMVEVDKRLKKDISRTFLQLCQSSIKDMDVHEEILIIEQVYVESICMEDCMFDVIMDPFYDKMIVSEERRDIELLLSFLLHAPLKAYSTIVRNASARIGPLRKIPDRNDLFFYMKEDRHSKQYTCVNSVTDWKMSWFDGSSAWRYLAENKKVILESGEDYESTETGELFPSINDWLSSQNKLEMPYKLDRRLKTIKYEDVLEPDNKSIDVTQSDVYHEAIAEIRLNAIAFEGSDLMLNLCDVGSGVSQVIPILVAGFVKHQILLEQPELHLHPKLQTDLADLFITRWHQDYLRTVIETHSEYLALRLLRRIRESKVSDIMPDTLRLDRNDIAFYYFDSVDGSTQVTELRVSDEGEFLDRWPKGFFSERERELFDEDY